RKKNRDRHAGRRAPEGKDPLTGLIPDSEKEKQRPLAGRRAPEGKDPLAGLIPDSKKEIQSQRAGSVLMLFLSLSLLR
ncbi:MAG: hypothetical protein IK093_06335, partial [Ruminiclostridium sp.]|nr:hypothetical protein [Ruminiclostridium sp.]